MENNYEQDYLMVLKEVLLMLRDNIPAIVASVLIAAVIGWSIAAFFLAPQYEASINMIVNTRTNASETVTNDNISSAQNLVDTYAVIIKSNTILNKVIEELGLEISFKDLYDMVSVNSIRNTQVMKISVRSEHPETSRKIVTTISAIAPAIVADAVEAGSCKVVSDVYVEEDPVSPNVKKIVIIAAGLGLLLSCAFLTLKSLMNDYIADDVDMESKIGVPVLAIIPDVEEN